MKIDDATSDGDCSDDEEHEPAEKDVEFLLVITSTGDAHATITTQWGRLGRLPMPDGLRGSTL